MVQNPSSTEDPRRPKTFVSLSFLNCKVATRFPLSLPGGREIKGNYVFQSGSRKEPRMALMGQPDTMVMTRVSEARVRIPSPAAVT